jgi:hypothetical protein
MNYWVVFNKERNNKVDTFTDRISAPSKELASSLFITKEEETRGGTITDIKVFTEEEFEGWLKQ